MAVGLVAFMVATSAHADSTNPWAFPPQGANPYGNNLQGQGGMNFGGNFNFNMGSNPPMQVPPSAIAPAPVVPGPQPVPRASTPSYGQYPPLTSKNTPSTLRPANPQAAVPRQPAYRPYGYGYPQNRWGPAPYGGGFNPFGFGGLSGFSNFGFGFGSGFGNNFGNGFGGPGIFTAPGPVPPGYGYGAPYYRGYGYGAPPYQAPPPVVPPK